MTSAFSEGTARFHEDRPEQEISDLLHSAEADLLDSRRDLPAVWRFGLACSSVVNLCNVILFAAGNRINSDPDQRVSMALPIVLGDDCHDAVSYLHSCLELRKQKNEPESTLITQKHADKLIRFIENFYQRITCWLNTHHSELVAAIDIPRIPVVEKTLEL